MKCKICGRTMSVERAFGTRDEEFYYTCNNCEYNPKEDNMSSKLTISIGERSRIDFRVADCKKTYHCKAYYNVEEQAIRYRVASIIGDEFGLEYTFDSLEEVERYVLEDSKGDRK